VSVLAVDLGGTWLRAAVVHPTGTLDWVERRRLQSVFDLREPEAVWSDVVDGIRAAAHSAAARGASRVALAFPGPMATGVPITAPTLTGSGPVPQDLIERIERSCGLSVRVVNDVAAAAAFLGTATGDSAFFVVTVSSGIGSRVFRRNAVSSGAPYDGEIGHLVVDVGPAAPLCDCGGRGHLGAISSGRAFQRLARSEASANPETFAASKCAARARADTLTNEEHLVPAIRSGDPWSVALLRRTVNPLARVALAVVVASGLERIYVIGGFAIALQDAYREALIAELVPLLDSPAIPVRVQDLVRVVDTGPEAVLRGAALAV